MKRRLSLLAFTALAVRNLMHDQVALQRIDVAGDRDEHGRARNALEQRWHELLSHEFRYRTRSRQATAATG